MLPKLNESIQKYYPGTKLAFTEYNFGGGQDISGAIVQADFLGLLAEYEVYFASIWAFDKSEYQFAAINMFTNYDNKGGYFADSLLESITTDDYTVSVYTGKNKTDGKTHIILINKEIHEQTEVTVKIGKTGNFTQAESYVLDGIGTTIRKSETPVKIKNGVMTVNLDPLTINHFVLD